MEFQVIYYSKTSHTKKVAETIASELGGQAENVKTAKLAENGMVFLGSGCYGGKPARSMSQFIEENRFNARNVALFGTSGTGLGMEVNEMEKILNTKEASVKGKFFCKGKFLLINRKRPNEEDLNEAKKFAKLMMEL